MISIELILYGVVGGLVGLKFLLLGLAAVLLIYALTERKRQRRMASTHDADRRPRLDVHA